VSLNPKEQKKRQVFLKRVSEIYGISVNVAQEMFTLERKSSLRLNTLKKDYKKTLENILDISDLEQISWYKNAYFIKSEKSKLTETDMFKQGCFYVQNASSLIPPIVLDPQEKEVILDMCAAPGGKTFQIGEMTKNLAFIYANDNSGPRLKTMKDLAETYGVKIVHYFQQPAQFLDRHTGQKFDKILLDAQCSGEGMIDFNNPAGMKYWNLKRIEKFSYLQKKMLRAAYNMLNPDGIIIYSTCTLAPEENEEVIDFGLKHFKGLEIEDFMIDVENAAPGITSWQKKILNPQVKKCLRILPTPFTEPFFVCKIKKNIKSL